MRDRYFLLALASAIAFAGFAVAQEGADDALQLHKPGAFPGLTLFLPNAVATGYLIDNDGHVIHTWDCEYRPGQGSYLLPNGNLLKSGVFGLMGNGTFTGGGAGYCVEEYSWEGEKVWEFVYSSEQHLMHHDIEPLPNGNVLILAWEMKTEEEAIQAGRNPDALRDGELWSEHIIEVKPIRPEGGEIVWEWHLWDHLVQDLDATKDNYGDVAAHPELVDIDPPGYWMDRISAEEMEALESLGYLAGDSDNKEQPDQRGAKADWLHINAIAYNPVHDLIALSVLGNNELWVLDHSTTTEEAKGHTGGNYGKGGDLLYRWGNPFAYRMGTAADQRIIAQHDVHWIAEGLPGAGNMLIFDNGRGRMYSRVIEIAPPFTKEEGFRREPGKPWGPAEPIWDYTAPNKKLFYSFFISGARRLPNGNTLICSGAQGTFFEVTPDKEEVWRYMNPVLPPAAEDESRSGRRGGFMQNTVSRVTRYPMDYPAFHGKDLTPGPLLTDFLKDNPPNPGFDLEDKVEI